MGGSLFSETVFAHPASEQLAINKYIYKIVLRACFFGSSSLVQ